MEYEKIKQLMNDMGESKLSSIDIDFPDGTKISMKKDKIQETVVQAVQDTPIMIPNTTIEVQKEEKGNIIKSPMVGIFYLKPSPVAEPYIELGKDVKKGDVLCIIEAMKLMNEIESDVDGEIVEICYNDEDLVEYGSVLFKIK